MNLGTSRNNRYQTALEHRPAHGPRAIRALNLLCGLFIFGASFVSAGAVRAEKSRVWMTIGERRFTITLLESDAARAFAAMLPLTIDMTDLNSNEKHADLPRALPTNAGRPGTIRNGDLMLYGSKTLVVFYLTFDSPYSYTRLGRVDDPADLAQALGRRDAQIVFSRHRAPSMQALP
ncbi:cyclophilin-like fold protein [Brenneria populi subsp. brevivirga]|uniref:cyclophilin-like fold protein n=1 Tax=Brenneria populi TaxID=1505588 RepID=UPI002E197A1D|nr:cyclophilin-like fold protein [Brenneria populi subsp. brevivirga]